MGRRIIYIFSGFLLFISDVYPLDLVHRLRVPIYFNWNSGIAYDSNYLKLSNSEINEVSLYPALLGDSETVSSVITINSLRIKYKPRLFNKHETQIRYKISFSNYFASPKKSYSSFSLYIAQHLGKYEWFKFSYSYMPGYYLRDYRDRDDNIINANTDGILEGCFFSQSSTTLSYSKWLLIKRTWIEGMLNFKTQYYNPEFTEFDLDINSFGLILFSNYYKKYSVQINLKQSFAENITYKNGLKSTEDINRGYDQQNILIKLERNNITSIVYQDLGFIYSITFRTYNSEIELDLLHHNRYHTERKINLWFRGALNSSIDYRIDFSHRYRNSISDSEWVVDLKGFNKIIYYFTISYDFSSDILY